MGTGLITNGVSTLLCCKSLTLKHWLGLESAQCTRCVRIVAKLGLPLLSHNIECVEVRGSLGKGFLLLVGLKAASVCLLYPISFLFLFLLSFPSHT